jgi:hypothetical protein
VTSSIDPAADSANGSSRETASHDEAVTEDSSRKSLAASCYCPFAVQDADVARAIMALGGQPVSLDIARARLPKTGGLYAWWIAKNVLPVVPSTTHHNGLDLLYIGIAPSGTSSTATLSSRVVGNHMRGNIAASTLRRTLAALLLDELKLTPLRRKTKVILPKEQNQLLSDWQQRHLKLTWHPTSKPWLLEHAVIAELAPPLNLAANNQHAFYTTLSLARRRLVESAK